MRLSEDKIKEAILYPNLDVRDVAIAYFSNPTNTDSMVMPQVIQAIERYGRTRAFSFTSCISRLKQTEQTIPWVIAELQREAEGPPEEWCFYGICLSDLLCHADISLVAPHAREILQARHFTPGAKVGFEERLEMIGWDAEQCWGALLHHCEINSDENNIDKFDLDHALRITEALARKPHGYKGRILDLLNEKGQDVTNDVRKWLQPLMANLAGAVQLREAIPLLVGNLSHPLKFLANQSANALAKIGDEDVVAAVCDQFPGGSQEFRQLASGLLCRIHLDTTVQRVLKLLPGETDPVIRIYLCAALLHNFSFECIEPARQLLKEQELTSDLRRVRATLIAVCKVMGSRFPEFDEWEAAAAQDSQAEWASMMQIQKLAFEAGGDLKSLVKNLEAQVAEKIAEKKRLQDEVARLQRLLAERSQPRPRSPMPRPKLPSPRARPDSTVPKKLGRNDPCPCGSGKKFKHCCLRA